MFQTSTGNTIEALVISENISPLTTLLRQKAATSGWPSEIAERLTVVDSDGSLLIHIPEDIDQKVMDLEYGTLGQMPSAVIRPFIYKYSPEVATSVGLASIYDLAMNGGGVY
jgi:hypothetical protein